MKVYQCEYRLGRVNACPQCGESKPCDQLTRQTRLAHGHRQTCRDCNRCRSYDTCACGHRKKVRLARCIACAPHIPGYQHHLWKRGGYTDARGYVWKLTPGHPHAQNKGRYVLEHRLVMEKALGRYLESHEEVHHLNGVSDDNRIENLELWTKPHPRGIRAEDAVAWAKEILRQYEPEALR